MPILLDFRGLALLPLLYELIRSEIAMLLVVSTMTVYRRRLECGMVNEPANNLTNQELCDLLQ